MKHIGLVLAAVLVVSVLPLRRVPVAQAHQPYCEEVDLTAESPFRVSDPTVSTAFYGTLFPETDVDYFAFRGEAGQEVLLGLTIPQVEGHEDFAPTFALFGPGIAGDEPDVLPEALVMPKVADFAVFAPGDEPPDSFYEPFSRTYYWERQETRVTLPEDGRYTVAVWHAEQRTGRYVMVIGDREVIGGDINCLMGLDEYFSPIDPVVEMERYEAAHDAEHDSEHDNGQDHDHGDDESHDIHEDSHHD